MKSNLKMLKFILGYDLQNYDQSNHVFKLRSNFTKWVKEIKPCSEIVILSINIFNIL